MDPGEVCRLLQDALLRHRQDHEAVEELLVEPEAKGALHLRKHPLGRPARVARRGLEEVEEGHRVRRVRGSGRHDHRGRVGRGAVARGVADGAGLGDAGEADGLLREPDRELAPLLPRDAEGAVAAGAGQQVGKDPREDVEDRVGHAQRPLRAERAVLEPLLRRVGAERRPPRFLHVAADDLRQLAKAHDPAINPARRHQDQDEGQPHEERRNAPDRSRPGHRAGLPQNVFRCSRSAHLSASASAVP